MFWPMIGRGKSKILGGGPSKRCQEIGAPGEIRTHDLCLRRAALYPAELRVHRRRLAHRGAQAGRTLVNNPQIGKRVSMLISSAPV